MSRQPDEVRTIVGGVELAAEAHVPARAIAERGHAASAIAAQDGERRRVRYLGYREMCRGSTIRAAIARSSDARRFVVGVKCAGIA